MNGTVRPASNRTEVARKSGKPNLSDIIKSALPEAAQQLIEEMRRIRFGRIEGLRVCSGLPTFEPRPRILLDRKIGVDTPLRPEEGERDFKVKSEVIELLRLFEALGDGLVVSLEIKNGLPIRLQMEG